MAWTNSQNRITHNIAATENKGNEDRFGKGLNCLPESLSTRDANLSLDQKISNRGAICTNQPNSPLIPFSLSELREAWAKRRYEAHFISKLTDCDGENNETDSSIDFAMDCGYIGKFEHAELVAECREIGKMLGGMIGNPTGFLIRQSRGL